MFKADDPATLRAEVRRRLNDDETLRIVLAALKEGASARLTKKGIVFAGENGGSVMAHWTASDWRAARNLEAELRRIGVDLPRVQRSTADEKAPTRRKPPKAPQRFRPLPKHYEVDTRPQTVTYTYTPEPEPLPELESERPKRREPGAKARALSSRRVHPRIAAMYARLSTELREVEPELLLEAIRTAGDDPRRVTVERDGSLMVWNRPAW